MINGRSRSSRHLAHRGVLSVVTGAFLVSLVSGCGSSSDDAKNSTSTTQATTTSSTVATTATSAAAPSATLKVSANTASASEITAALQAAGVSNAERWTDEVIEYRPYPTNDPNLAKLRTNLTKYKPGDETMNKIISALQP